eukprot:GFYU01011457.1.p1 GENE.GFYU01011457.1~~GFYU01011457.1.p1  ORF type:complete len:380 (+),score=68.72 GFYU01011457.1:56-1141(+)
MQVVDHKTMDLEADIAAAAAATNPIKGFPKPSTRILDARASVQGHLLYAPSFRQRHQLWQGNLLLTDERVHDGLAHLLTHPLWYFFSFSLYGPVITLRALQLHNVGDPAVVATMGWIFSAVLVVWLCFEFGKCNKELISLVMHDFQAWYLLVNTLAYSIVGLMTTQSFWYFLYLCPILSCFMADAIPRKTPFASVAAGVMALVYPIIYFVTVVQTDGIGIAEYDNDRDLCITAHLCTQTARILDATLVNGTIFSVKFLYVWVRYPNRTNIIRIPLVKDYRMHRSLYHSFPHPRDMPEELVQHVLERSKEGFVFDYNVMDVWDAAVRQSLTKRGGDLSESESNESVSGPSSGASDRDSWDSV